MEKETFQYVTVDAKDVPPPGEFARENAVNFVLEKVPEPEIAPEQSTPPPSLKAGITTDTFWPTLPSEGGLIAVGRAVPLHEGKIQNDTSKKFVAGETSLERRVKKLEEQVDSLLDRIAKYNQRAQHRI